MVVIKILEPIGRDPDQWMQDFRSPEVAIEYQDTRAWKEEALADYIKDAEILVLGNRPLSARVLEACPLLKLLAVAFTGIDHIDREVCRKRGIEIKNAAGYATHAVAELAVGLAISLSRKLIPASASMTKEGLFPLGAELYDKQVGIIGGGLIGQETGRLFRAFGCRVVFFHHSPLQRTDIKQVLLEELLRESDFISLHIPLKEDTRHFLNRKRLSFLKPSAYLINTGRGALVDQEALIDLLKEKKIAGAALDVFEEEPPLSKDHPLLQAPHVILTPHIGYRTQEASEAKANLVSGHVKQWLVSKGIELPRRG